MAEGFGTRVRLPSPPPPYLLKINRLEPARAAEGVAKVWPARVAAQRASGSLAIDGPRFPQGSSEFLTVHNPKATRSELGALGACQALCHTIRPGKRQIIQRAAIAAGLGMDEQHLRAMMQEHHTASYGWARVCAARLGVEADTPHRLVHRRLTQ